MQTFSRNRIILLPHAEEYRGFYKITLSELGQVLSDPETVAELSDGCYTAEKNLGKKRIAIFYYRRFPCTKNRMSRMRLLTLLDCGNQLIKGYHRE